MRTCITITLTLLTWTGLQLYLPGTEKRALAAAEVAPVCAPDFMQTLEFGPRPWACRENDSIPTFQRYLGDFQLGQGVAENLLLDRACSLVEISRLGIGFERLDGEGELYLHRLERTTWLAFARVVDPNNFGFPMCRRGARRGDDRGPNPWQEMQLQVRMGPAVVETELYAAQQQPQMAEPVYPAQSAEGYLQAGAQNPSLSPGYTAMTPLPMEGLAMYYNPGIMRQVVEYRENMGEIEDCMECVGYAALLRAGDLNRRIWIRWGDGEVEGPFLVADVAARHHVEMLIQRGWAVDVDNQTAVRRGMFMPMPVTIYAAPPGRD